MHAHRSTFLVLALLTTFVPSFAPAGDVLSALARRVLVLTLFLVGASLSPAALRRVGARPFLQGAVLWGIVSTVSLGVILGAT